MSLEITNSMSGQCLSNQGGAELIVYVIKKDGTEEFLARSSVYQGDHHANTGRFEVFRFDKLKLEIDGGPGVEDDGRQGGRWCDSPFLVNPQVEVIKQ